MKNPPQGRVLIIFLVLSYVLGQDLPFVFRVRKRKAKIIHLGGLAEHLIHLPFLIRYFNIK